MSRLPPPLLGALASCTFLLLPAVSFGASSETSLTPTGAPAPTLRTLDQIEPRTPISGSCAITQPGSYYLTGNINTTSSGITILTNNVTLDLMGHTLSGDRGSADYGIRVDGDANAVRRGICIRNGTVTAFGNGLTLENARNCRIEDVVCTTNLNIGFYLNAENNGTIKDNVLLHCVAAENSLGIALDGTDGGVCEGNRIQDCIVERNANHGIDLNGNTGKCAYNSLLSTTVRNNKWGVSLMANTGGLCFGNTVRGCAILGNTYDGLYLQGEGGTCSGNWMQNNQVLGNKQYGIRIGYGVENVLTGNDASASGSAGFNVTNGNLVFQNSSAASGQNFQLGASAVYGPIISASGSLSTTGESTHPWANFSR